MYHTATGARVNDVSRHAESIGEPPSLWEGLYVVHPEVGLLGALFKPQFCLCVCVDGRPAVSHLSRCWVAWRTWETFGLQTALLSHRNTGALLVIIISPFVSLLVHLFLVA